MAVAAEIIAHPDRNCKFARLGCRLNHNTEHPQILWRARQDSNLWPLASEANALSN